MMKIYLLLWAFVHTHHVVAQSSSAGSGYTDYSLRFTGDSESTVYETASTPSNATLPLTPDVFLNASLHVGEISILVRELQAKINIDAKVLDLLDFNAGVAAKIGKVQLLIQNVTAKAQLEARLGNVVKMVSSVLDSIDLNPVLAQLGNTVGEVLTDVGNVVENNLVPKSSAQSKASTQPTAASKTNQKRGFLEQSPLSHNILYSVNDYNGNIHTNRILSSNGDIVDEALNNGGERKSKKTVGNVQSEMQFTGKERLGVEIGNRVATEREYLYAPFPGLELYSRVYFDSSNVIVGTQVIVELEGGGTSTVSSETRDM